MNTYIKKAALSILVLASCAQSGKVFASEPAVVPAVDLATQALECVAKADGQITPTIIACGLALPATITLACIAQVFTKTRYDKNGNPINNPNKITWTKIKELINSLYPVAGVLSSAVFLRTVLTYELANHAARVIISNANTQQPKPVNYHNCTVYR